MRRVPFHFFQRPPRGPGLSNKFRDYFPAVSRQAGLDGARSPFLFVRLRLAQSTLPKVLVVPRASTATLLALLLTAVGDATGIRPAQSQTEAAPIPKNANDSGHNRRTGAAP